MRRDLYCGITSNKVDLMTMKDQEFRMRSRQSFKWATILHLERASDDKAILHATMTMPFCRIKIASVSYLCEVRFPETHLSLKLGDDDGGEDECPIFSRSNFEETVSYLFMNTFCHHYQLEEDCRPNVGM